MNLVCITLASLMALISADAQDTARLVAAYPDALAASPKPNVILFKDGVEMLYDDGVSRTTLDERLARGTIRDQMSIPYPRGWPFTAPAPDSDPGRIRYEPLFRKLYGNSPREVAQSLIPVQWGNTIIRFTRLHGAARALADTAREIEALPDAVRKCVAQPIGSFVWRQVEGEQRLSPHSFGIAVDFQLPGPVHRYWRWDKKTPPEYPREVLTDANLGIVVAIFERHGFIWGGKWSHYDTMHFEYRPELTPPSATATTPNGKAG